MKKIYIINAVWFLAAFTLAAVFALYFYSSTGLDRCYWNNIDSDFCYSVAALRFLDNYPTGFVEHTAAGEGLPVVQLLGWFYMIMSKIGLLSESTFASLTSHQDPLVYLQQFVVSGWLFGSIIYLMVVTTVFWFTRLLTRSNIISFVASLISAISWSNIQFLLRIRSEAFSACLALIALYLMFKSVKSTSLRLFAFYTILSSVSLGFALFAKRNAMPYLFFLPSVLLLVPYTSLERSNSVSRGLLLRCAIIGNLVFLPPLLPLLLYWPEFVGSFSLILTFVLVGEVLGLVLLVTTFVFMIFVLRTYISRRNWQNYDALRRCSRDTLIYLLLLCIGFEMAAYISFVHPTFNRYTLFLTIMIVASGLFAILLAARDENVIRVVLNRLRLHILNVRTITLTIVATILWAYYWYVTSRGVAPLSTNIEISVSRSLFEILHPQSSMSLLSYGDNVFMSDYLRSVSGAWFSHYRNLRWPELLVVLIAILQLVRTGRTTGIKTIIFLILVGMGLLFFSAMRLLYPFYIIYEDIVTIVAVAISFGCIIDTFGSRFENNVSMNISVISLTAAVILISVSSVRRIQETSVMQSQAMSSGCSLPPSGDTCMCDPYYAGSRFGGTGLKDVIESQYGFECMQAVEIRAAEGIPLQQVWPLYVLPKTD